MKEGKISTKVKERLKELRLELEQTLRWKLDNALEKYTGKTCDESIELLDDDKVRELVRRIKKRKKKQIEVAT